jgi:hypothetical protein
LRAKDREKEEARGELRKLCPPGSTIYTILRHVSRSGMSRAISLYSIRENEPVYLAGYAAKALGYSMHRSYDGALRVDGCGMDMGFHLVHSLSYAVHGWPERVERPRPIGEEMSAEEVSTFERDEQLAMETWLTRIGVAGSEPRRRIRPGYTFKHRWI